MSNKSHYLKDMKNIGRILLTLVLIIGIYLVIKHILDTNIKETLNNSSKLQYFADDTSSTNSSSTNSSATNSSAISSSAISSSTISSYPNLSGTWRSTGIDGQNLVLKILQDGKTLQILVIDGSRRSSKPAKAVMGEFDNLNGDLIIKFPHEGGDHWKIISHSDNKFLFSGDQAGEEFEFTKTNCSLNTNTSKECMNEITKLLPSSFPP